MNINYLKALIAGLALVCLTALLMTNSIDQASGFGLMGTIVGYVIGNGVQARSGADVPGIIRPNPTNRRESDTERV